MVLPTKPWARCTQRREMMLALFYRTTAYVKGLNKSQV